MKTYLINDSSYRLPDALTDFQLDMYVHLVNWKWNHLTQEPGYHNGIPYDALLPKELEAKHHPLYQPVIDVFLSHQKKFPFKVHTFIGHMASSQAACANLFLPLLQYPDIAAQILRAVKTDLHKIATEYFDSGYRLEFWDEPDNMLNDHNSASGTDADIAIAYRDEADNLKLWLIEHKLTEKEFTPCGGYKSKKRDKYAHRCNSIADILNDRRLCYYHSGCSYRYWDITLSGASCFAVENLLAYKKCPFKDGLNQLWRNQLLAIAIQSSQSPRWPFKSAYFSVVHHPKNESLTPTINLFKQLTSNSDKFFTFSSRELVEQAKQVNFAPLQEWLTWYQGLYYY